MCFLLLPVVFLNVSVPLYLSKAFLSPYGLDVSGLVLKYMRGFEKRTRTTQMENRGDRLGMDPLRSCTREWGTGVGMGEEGSPREKRVLDDV